MSDCPKIGYQSKAEALLAMDGINKRMGPRNKIKHVYRCRECHQWHTTRWTKSLSQYINKKLGE